MTQLQFIVCAVKSVLTAGKKLNSIAKNAQMTPKILIGSPRRPRLQGPYRMASGLVSFIQINRPIGSRYEPRKPDTTSDTRALNATGDPMFVSASRSVTRVVKAIDHSGSFVCGFTWPSQREPGNPLSR